MRPGLAAIVARAKLAAMPTPDATPPDSSHKLAHVLVLDDGTKLVTLRDAANVLTERFGTVTSWRVIELIEQLYASRCERRTGRYRGDDRRDRARVARPALAVTARLVTTCDPAAR